MARLIRAARKSDRPYHHGNLRRALLDEALATIRTEGVDGLTLREIGARLGVSRTALYRHFADKRALLAAVATEGFRTLRQQLVIAWEEGGRGRAAFESLGVAYVRFAVANPSHYRVMFGGFVNPKACEPELAAEAAGAFQALVDALATLQRNAIMRAEDTVKMARFAWAVVHGVAMLGIDGQLREPGSVEELMRYALERLRSGIEAETDHRPAGAEDSGPERASTPDGGLSLSHVPRTRLQRPNRTAAPARRPRAMRERPGSTKP